MFTNGSTFTRSGNTNDDKSSASELNLQSKKFDNNQIEIISPNKRNASNTTYKTNLAKPELCTNHNNAKGHILCKRETQQKFQNLEDLRKVVGDLDLEDDKLRVEVSCAINNQLSSESHRTIAEIVEKVGRLSAIERLLLYLRLPTGKELTDPLKLPLNPLGSRFEISQTVTWIQTHLKENQAVSLPKQEVYEEYKVYCNKNMMKPLSTADFGKVMKQVFPEVRPRRLGTRGNSRYCYAGLCKMTHLPVPQLPKLNNCSETEDTHCKMKDVVCSWLGYVMGKKFDSFEEIGKHFLSFEKKGKEPVLTIPCEAKSATVPPNCVRTKSTELNLSNKKTQDNDNKPSTQETVPTTSVESTQTRQQQSIESVGRVKRTVPNILIRKRPSSSSLYENITDKKLKSSAHQSVCSDESVCDINNHRRVKEDPLNSGNQRISISSDLIPDKSTKSMPLIPRVKRFSSSDSVNSKSSVDCSNVKDKSKLSVNVVCDNKLKEKMVFSPVQESNTLQIGSKLPIPRLPKQCRNKPAAANLIVLPAVVSPSITRHKPIQLCPVKVNNEKINISTDSSTDTVSEKHKQCFIRKQGSLQDKNDNQVSVSHLEKDVLDDYLHSDGNSQEQEEELLKYFQPQSPVISSPIENDIYSERLSQLRSLLEKNMNSSVEEKCQTLKLKIVDLPSVSNVTSTVVDDIRLEASINISQINQVVNQISTSTGTSNDISQHNQRPNLVLPSDYHLPKLIADSNLNSRRRVSFENLPDSVPQSPNTRRKIFNFTPISPTKTKSVCGSPFVSPRDMQMPRVKIPTNSSHSNQTNVHPLSPVISAQSSSPMNQKWISCNDSVLKSQSPTANLYLQSVLSTDAGREASHLQSVTSKLTNSAGISSAECKTFLLPCSPVSVNEPPVLNAKENILSPKQLDGTEEKLNQIPSLLQSILTYGKYKVKAETQQEVINIGLQKQEEIYTKNVSNFSVSDPLSQEVSKFFPEGNISNPIVQSQSTYRSHSVPVVSSSALMPPLTVTQPFSVFYSTPNQFDNSVIQTPVPSEIADFESAINAESSSSNFLLMTDENDVQNFEGYDVPNSEQNDLLIDSAMNRIFEMITDSSKTPILGIGENEKCLQPSRSYPNTPIPYSISFENNSRDPIVSAFAPKPPSRSYPSTPVFSTQLLNTTDSLLNSSSTVRRNINLLLPDSSSSLGLLTKEEEENLSLQCEDTFNVLATVVSDDVGGETVL